MQDARRFSFLVGFKPSQRSLSTAEVASQYVKQSTLFWNSWCSYSAKNTLPKFGMTCLTAPSTSHRSLFHMAISRYLQSPLNDVILSVQVLYSLNITNRYKQHFRSEFTVTADSKEPPQLSCPTHGLSWEASGRP